ncbi:hypothetical protein DRO53_02015 [Candidatus Bathyarchaeota archaeon]|nr:MAG: hypothetical protein DRO46_00240 [Candidatus Hecatellales archaeon]RLI35118.1 MAG: hypothetical protein DRO53_02015 [Candidatus Bathyarchaeota archaeon]
MDGNAGRKQNMNRKNEEPVQITPIISFAEVQSIIESEFPVEAVVFEFGSPSFKIKVHPDTKQAFQRLVKKLKPYGLIPLLRSIRGEPTIKVLVKPPVSEKPSRLPPILFAITVVTIFISGYINSTVWSRIFQENIYMHAAFFTIALLAIVGLHELGHKISAMISGIKSTLPYFIPGPPFPIGFGTLGAVIMQKEPPVNRDQLFDLGFSGPVTGFIITILVAILAVNMSRIVEPSFMAQLEAQGISLISLPSTLAWELIMTAFAPEAAGNFMLMPPIGMAAWIGFVITYLNLLPAWQLDGGHIARAMFGEKGHMVASFIGVVVAFLTGFWFFGLLILFLMGRKHMGPLDDLSPLSRGRLALGVLAYAILVLSAVVFMPL